MVLPGVMRARPESAVAGRWPLVPAPKPATRDQRPSTSQRARLLQPPIQRRGARVAADQHMLDGASDAALLAGAGRHLAEQEVGGVAVVGLGVRVHLEVLDLEPVV